MVGTTFKKWWSEWRDDNNLILNSRSCGATKLTHEMEGEENDDELQSCLIISNQERGCCYGGEMIEEAKRQLGLALPLIAVNILQYCLQVISVMFVGHLGDGELPLSGASMATSFASVTGFSVLVILLLLLLYHSTIPSVGSDFSVLKLLVMNGS